MISTITDLTKSEEPILADANQPIAEQFATRPADANRQTSGQSATPRDFLIGLSDENFKRFVDTYPRLAKKGVRYEMREGKMIRSIPSAETLGEWKYNSPSANNNTSASNETSANDETYNTPPHVEDAAMIKHREELHQKQIQQLKELYR